MPSLDQRLRQLFENAIPARFPTLSVDEFERLRAALEACEDAASFRAVLPSVLGPQGPLNQRLVEAAIASDWRNVRELVLEVLGVHLVEVNGCGD